MAFQWIIGCACSHINTERNSIHVEQFNVCWWNAKAQMNSYSFPDIQLTWTGRGSCYIDACPSIVMKFTCIFLSIRSTTWLIYYWKILALLLLFFSKFSSGSGPSSFKILDCISPRFWMFLLWRSTASWGAMLTRTRSRGKADTATQKLVQAVEAYGNIFTSYSPRWKNWACLHHENPTFCQNVYTFWPFFFLSLLVLPSELP